MKRLFRLGETEVWAHWTALPAVLFLTVVEGPGQVGLGMLALLLHELGHLRTARSLGHHVRSLELWPFGAALSADVGPGSSGALPVLLAGPLCNLAASGMSLVLLRLLPRTGEVMEPFFRINLTLGAANLLPAEPLDGGGALVSLLSRALGVRRARRFTAWLGVASGGALLALGVYGAFLGLGSETALLFAVFLLFSGVRALLGEDVSLEELIDRQTALQAGRPLEVREAALYADRTAREALRALRRGRYTLIRVIGKEDRVLAPWTRGPCCRGFCRGEGLSLYRSWFSCLTGEK